VAITVKRALLAMEHLKEEGRIVQEGRPGVIFAAPTNERTRVFLQSVLDRNAELESAGAISTSGE
jgi:ABC-type histidine transport system ATPase subunit